MIICIPTGLGLLVGSLCYGSQLSDEKAKGMTLWGVALLVGAVSTLSILVVGYDMIFRNLMEYMGHSFPGIFMD